MASARIASSDCIRNIHKQRLESQWKWKKTGQASFLACVKIERILVKISLLKRVLTRYEYCFNKHGMFSPKRVHGAFGCGHFLRKSFNMVVARLYGIAASRSPKPSANDVSMACRPFCGDSCDLSGASLNALASNLPRKAML